jgi:hypothetical protein
MKTLLHALLILEGLKEEVKPGNACQISASLSV